MAMTNEHRSRRSFLKTIGAGTLAVGLGGLPFGPARAQDGGSTFLYVSNFADNSLSRFQVGTDGNLTFAGQPFTHEGLNRNDRIEAVQDPPTLLISNLAGEGGINVLELNDDGSFHVAETSPAATGFLFNDLELTEDERWLLAKFNGRSASQRAAQDIEEPPPLRRLSGLQMGSAQAGVVPFDLAAGVAVDGDLGPSFSPLSSAVGPSGGLSNSHRTAFAGIPSDPASPVPAQAGSSESSGLMNVGFDLDTNESILQRVSLNENSGQLELLTESRVNGLIWAVTASPDGFFYGPNRDQNVIHVVTPSGELLGETIPNQAGAQGPNGATVHPNGRWLFLTNHVTSNVSVFRINEDSSLEPGPGPFITFGSDTTTNASGEPTVSGDGSRLYVTNPQSNDVTVFRINEDTGELTFVSTFPTGCFPLGIEEISLG